MEPTQERADFDRLPEFYAYRDEGCELARSCLACVLPACVLDQPRGKQRQLKKSRDKAITRLFAGEGKGIRELAALFGVSTRTVQRALQKRRNEGGRTQDDR